MKFSYVYGKDVRDEYPNVSVSIERITPSVAKLMLESNVANRNMKREPLSKAITAGEWFLNGASIVFSDDGVLLDGQNRLNACVVANTPIDTIVIRGLKREAQETMDIGVKRQLKDFLQMNGYKNATNVAAMAVAMQRSDVYGFESAFHKPNGSDLTLPSSIRFVEENYDIRIEPLMKQTMAMQKKFRGISCGTIACLLERFNGSVSDEDFECFYNQLMGYAVPCQPVVMLKNRLESNSISKTGRLPQKTIAAFIIKAFNAYMNGEDIKCLKFTQGGANPETFPQIWKDEEVA